MSAPLLTTQQVRGVPGPTFLVYPAEATLFPHFNGGDPVPTFPVYPVALGDLRFPHSSCM